MTTGEPKPAMPDETRCPQCGAHLVAGALGGLCPACLFQQGAAEDSITGAPAGAFEPPSVDDLAPLFPQLEIFELIGTGGMGAVYKARQKELDRVVALKILPPVMGDTPGFAERFSREAKALAKLNHPGIVTIHEFGRADGLFYFLMEFVDGVNLRQLLAGGRVSPREALAIVPEICDALQFAHDHGIVHRDIKPANILLDRRGRVKIADFGLAKLVAQHESATDGSTDASADITLTEAGKRMGTPSYMAPEQSEHPGEVDHRADIYALGVVFYQMLTGELPQDRITPPSRKVAMDVRLDEIVLRTLEKQPELRYQQARDVKTAMETITSTSASAARSTVVAAPVSAPSRVRTHLGWFAAVAIAAVAVVYWLVVPRRPDLAGEQNSSSKPVENVLAAPPRLDPAAKQDSAVEAGGNIPGDTSPDGEAGKKSGFQQWLPTQIATIDSETGGLMVKSADGGAYGILAVSSAEKPNVWWRPDGKPVTNEGFEIRGEPAHREPLADREHFLWFDFRGDRSEGGHYAAPDAKSFEPTGALHYASSVNQNGKLFPGVWAQRLKFPRSALTVTMRTRVGLEKWRRISTLDPHKRHFDRTPSVGDPDFNLYWLDPVNTDDGLQIGVVLRADPRFWTTQIIAVDTNGVRYRPMGGGTLQAGADAYIHTLEHFEPIPDPETQPHGATQSLPKLSLAAVKEFRAEVQPVYFVEFRDIALQPNEPAPAATPK